MNIFNATEQAYKNGYNRGVKEVYSKLYPQGTRIELRHMDDPCTTLKPGDRGTVDYVDDAGTIHMRWDNGSSLGLIVGEDSFIVIKDED